MDRRELLQGSALAIASMAAPVLVSVGNASWVEEAVLKAFAVGTDSGEMDWQFVLAESAEMAEKLYAEEHGFECDCGSDDNDCECHLAYIDSQRVSAWDALGDSGPSGVDWVSAGLSHSCGICHEACSSEDDIITIGTRHFIVCEACRKDDDLNLPKTLGVTS